MSEESVERLFESLYRLTDLRGIFRETAPGHELSEEQKEEVKEIIDEVRENLDSIEGEMIQ